MTPREDGRRTRDQEIRTANKELGRDNVRLAQALETALNDLNHLRKSLHEMEKRYTALKKVTPN